MHIQKMKHTLKTILITIVLVLSAIPNIAFAQTTRTVLQEQFGKQTITVGSNETITFYDPWGENGIFEYGRHNSHSLAVFTPESNDMAVVISFEYVDMHGKVTIDDEDGEIDVYEGEINIYDGDADPDNSWSWSTTIAEVHHNKSLPTEGLLAHLDGSFTNLSYASNASDGSLSVGLFWRTANNSRGWKATVRCVSRNNMTTVSAGASYDKVVTSPTQTTGVTLGSFFINTNGVLNADHLRSVTFQFTRNDGVFMPSQLRVFRGEESYFDSDEALATYVTNNNGTYTITLDEALTNGKNTYSIVGDILNSAPFGGKASLSITQITSDQKPSGIRPFDKGTPVTITNPAMLLMQEGHKTVTIGDTNIDFYDDGGALNDVTPGFEGSVTFIPETAGKKIRIDFKSVDLSKGSLRFQQINIYNGREMNSANLIGSLKYSEKGVFNSTAEDGSLTVEFLSNETMQTASGFHAVVSQQIPNAMELKRIDVMQGSEDPVCAGDKDQPIMTFNLYTENTLPAITIDSFSFNTGNTFPIISRATLYSTGKTKEFSKQTKVGETVINSNDFVITPTTPFQLSEHDNYFTLVYDIIDEAEFDQTIDANFISMKINGNTYDVTNGASKGNRTVENIVYSYLNQGVVTKVVAVDLNFESKDEFSNRHSYEPGTDDRTNIFVPKHSGAICQIDFSEFLIQYVEGYEGSHKSKFEIYSGQGSSRQLLWQLNSVSQRDKGPGEPLRSTADDGSLTVVFNPNDAMGYYVAPGFKATVSEYTPRIMTVKEISVEQASSEIINNGAKDERLLSMNLETVGNLSTINAQGIGFSLKGNQQNISKVYVYYSGKENSPSSNGVLIGTATPDNNQILNLNFSTNINLTEGNNYFNILVDVADDAPTGSVVDASIISVKLDGVDIPVSGGDPNGERIVKNITPKDMQVNSLNAIAFADGNARKGENDVLMMRIELEVEGENKLLSIENLQFDVSGSAIDKIKVYQTGLSNEFSPANCIGETIAMIPQQGSERKTIDVRYPLTQEGKYYLWAVCDVSENAKVGDKFSLSMINATISSNVYTVSQPQTTMMTVVAGKQGTLTVGTEGDYPTIQAAVDAISDGIDGAVTIEIQPGIYNERVMVPYIKGTSERNPIIIKGISENPRDVRIYHNSWEELPYTDDRMAREFGLFTFDKASYVTLQNVEITTTALNYPSLIHLKNASRHITIDNCYLHTATTTSNLEGVNLIYGYAKNEANQNNDYLTVRNCLLEGGYIGVNMGGTNYVNLAKEVGGIVENNTFREQGFKAIYVMDELGAQIRGNKVFNSVSDKGNFSAIDTQIRDAYDKPMIIEGNSINLYCVATAYGLYLRELTGSADCPVNIINNEIIFGSNQSDAYPVYMTRANNYLNFANNTIKAYANGGTTMWLAREMGENVNVINNIFISTTGREVINLGVKNNASAVNFSNNIYYTNGTTFARASASDIAYSSFEDWKNSTGDMNSINKNVEFLSDEILEPANNLDGSLLTGLPLDYVSTDITGHERSQQPSIGAYEYDGNDDSPLMLNGLPTVNNITDTSASIMISPDKNVTAYVICRLQSESQPLADDLLASDNKQEVRRNDVIGITVEGLTTGETYVGYIVLESLRGKRSQVYATDPFTAEGFKLIELPTPILHIAGNTTINGGETATITASIESGTAPFAITWKNGKHEIIKEEVIGENSISTLNYQPTECDDYFISVVDRYGKTAADTVRIIVEGDAVCATFENLFVDETGYYNGRDLRGSFVSGSYLFESTNMPQYSYWYGFAYTNSTATNFINLYPDQFNNAVGGGRNGSENYVVAYPENNRIIVKNKQADKLRGFYITNSAYTMDAIVNGDGLTDGAFGYGDYLRLSIIGTKPDGTTTTKYIYLADYQNTKNADNYALDTWQWVDLRSLGEVESIQFRFLSTRNNSYGMTTPAYFCIDDFNGERDIIDGGTLYSDVPLDLKTIFSFDNYEATIRYSLDEETSDEMSNSIELTDDGQIHNKKTGVEGEVIICAVQSGKQQFARISLSNSTSISDLFDGGQQNVGSSWEAIYSSEGQLVKNNYPVRESLDKVIQTLPQGVYIVRMNNNQTRKITIGTR